MTRQKEEFVPMFKDPQFSGSKKTKTVGIYSCGPTVYRDPHIGNLRAYHFADILRSIIQNILGYQLKHVVNLTDVGHLTDDADDGEDKMEQGAKRDKITVWQLANKYIEHFLTAIEKLNIDRFDVMPRATEHIPEQIEMIQKLEKLGYTYIIPNDGVYMDTYRVENYGALGNLDKQTQKAGARIQNENKKNPTDFALWKLGPKDSKRQMERDSPWGKGFPGWHIECSAMSSKYLGDQFDIHTGGVDHIGVHHGNEIAQSECCFGKKPWVKYRMHNQFLNLGGKKLAKSEGGLITLDTVIQKGYDPMDLRYFYFTAHYRSFLDFSRELLDQARKSRLNLKKKLLCHSHERICYSRAAPRRTATEGGNPYGEYDIENYKHILESILDDLNTPKLLASIHTLLSPPSLEDISFLKRLDDNFLKLDLFELEERIDIPKKIQDLAQKRREAKQSKNRTLADEIREKLKEKGYIIKDSGDGFEVEEAI